MTRHESREQAFILLFERSFNKETELSELIELAEEYSLLEPDEFFLSLVRTADEKDEELNEIISANTRGWKLNRISKVSLAVIKTALTEMIYLEDIPTGVSINEAVELAKKYATPEDASFVNGLLGTVARSQNA